MQIRWNNQTNWSHIVVHAGNSFCRGYARPTSTACNNHSRHCWTLNGLHAKKGLMYHCCWTTQDAIYDEKMINVLCTNWLPFHHILPLGPSMKLVAVKVKQTDCLRKKHREGAVHVLLVKKRNLHRRWPHRVEQKELRLDVQQCSWAENIESWNEMASVSTRNTRIS